MSEHDAAIQGLKSLDADTLVEDSVWAVDKIAHMFSVNIGKKSELIVASTVVLVGLSLVAQSIAYYADKSND